MFSRDSHHYAPTPRSLQTSKAGPYAQMSRPAPKVSAVSVLVYLAGVACAVAMGLLLAWRG